MPAAWPSTLPRPVAQGYSLSPLSQVLRTDMDVGPARTRRRTRARLDRVRATWIFTDAQMAAFRAWFDDDTQAAGGAAWFSIALALGTGGLVSKQARFVSDWSADNQGALVWQVSAELEVRDA